MAKQQKDYIYGRQTVKEAVLAGNVNKIITVKGRKGNAIQEIIILARKKGITCEYINTGDFDTITPENDSSGGIAAQVKPFKYMSFDSLIGKLDKGKENSLVLLLDHLEDPHNLGALLRTAEATGACGVVIPSDRAAGVNATVRKVAAGAAEWISVVKVVNLARSIDQLKERGFWVYGADGKGDTAYFQADWNRPVALVLGSEGRGLSDLIRKKCDVLINIPMAGIINSLNVSVAGCILMYEFFRRKMT